MSFLTSDPKASLMDVFKRWPEQGKTLNTHAEALMRGDGPLSEAEREVIGAYVSGLNHCDFCRASHTVTAEALGAPAGMVEDLLTDLEGAGVADDMRVLLGYLRKLTLDERSVTEADAKAVYAAGWDDAALFHAVSICAFFNMMNRLVHGLGIGADPETAETAGRYLHEHGYMAIVDYLGHVSRRGQAGTDG